MGGLEAEMLPVDSGVNLKIICKTSGLVISLVQDEKNATYNSD